MRRCGHEIWAREMGSEVKIWVESRDVNKILGSDTGFLTLPFPFRILNDPLVFVASGCAYFASEKNNALPSRS